MMVLGRQHGRALPSLLWRTAGSGRIGLLLLFFLGLDLGTGFLSLRGRVTLFEPMNQVGLWPWLSSYGLANLRHTAWFMAFLVLLALLALNTLACTCQRLARLFGQRRRAGIVSRLAVHGMHLGLLVILAGFLASYSLSTVSPAVTLLEDLPVTDRASGLDLCLEELELPRYSGDRLPAFAGRVIRPRARILVSNEHGRRLAELGFNSPVRFSGRTIFLQRFAPTGRGSMNGPHYVVVDIRRDPGVALYFSGLVLFSAAMATWAVRAGRKTP